MFLLVLITFLITFKNEYFIKLNWKILQLPSNLNTKIISKVQVSPLREKSTLDAPKMMLSLE